MSNKLGGYIELAKLNEESIVIEKMEDFQKSIFNAVYEKAQLLLDDIVKENRKIKAKEKVTDTDIDTDQVLSVNNVISFEGRRGTGKTSVMLSFRKSLENYKNECAFEDNRYKDRKKYREGIRFSIIDYIDASKLERGEQLLALVLANMFQRLREKDGQVWKKEEEKHQHNDLYRLFDEVYGSVLSLKDMRRDYQDESPLRALTQLSNSQILQKKIRKLVKLYLRYMEKENCCYGGKIESYLVITIDDLDMYFQEKGESPFEMLETLHRYLMIPGVVILMTYNAKELHLGCEKHFADIYHSKYEKLEKEDIQKQVADIQKLSREYLKKVLPIHTRIHMVSWRKRDYGVDNEIKIFLKKKEVEEYLGEFASYFLEEEKEVNSKEEQSVLLEYKKFLFLLKASKTGIFYDACGEKRHYSEPVSLRDLAHEVELYKYIGDLQNENHKYKELLDGLYFRFAKEHLLRGEQEEFDKYLAVPFYRRSKDILTHLRDLCREKEKAEISLIKYVGEAEKSYSYGELLYGLYKASKNGWFSKQMVWCILDSYTIMLTKYYKKMIAAENERDAEKEKKKIMDIIGASVASSWSNLLLPEWKITDKVQSSKPAKEPEKKEGNEEQKNNYEVNGTDKKGMKLQVGAVKFSQTENFAWRFELQGLSKEELDKDLKQKPVEQVQQELKKQLQEDLAKQLQQFEILNMFFSDIHHDTDKGKKPGFSIKYIPNKLGGTEEKKVQDADQEPQLQMECTDACFNIMNFVQNLLRGEKFFEDIRKKLGTEYKEYFSGLQKNMNDIKNDIKNHKNNENDENNEKAKVIEKLNIDWLSEIDIETFLAENSLYKKYQGWFNETHGLAMPVYSFDMMYNIFKRYYQKRETSLNVPNEEAVLENVKEVYKGIGERLREEDRFYYTNKENDNVNMEEQGKEGMFYTYYQNSPFIDYIFSENASETFRKRFVEMLNGIRRILVNKPESSIRNQLENSTEEIS